MPRFSRVIGTVDAHAAGEPLRIVVSGLPPLHGSAMLDRRRNMSENFDHVRSLLMLEPRGHSDMYGCIVTPPASDDGDLGVLFMHNEGYSTMCGHGIMAVVRVAVEMGLVAEEACGRDIRIDTPAGRVTARAHLSGARAGTVSFTNVPSFAYQRDVSVTTGDGRPVNVDIVFGGAFYALVDAESLGVPVGLKDIDRLVAAGMDVKRRVARSAAVVHPLEPELNGVYGTIIAEPARREDGVIVSRNVTIFADGQVDRSPTGTGTAARIAVLAADGLMREGDVFRNRSVIDTVFEGRIAGLTEVAGRPAVIPEISGTAHICALCQFLLEPCDPLPLGFRVRPGL